MIDKETEKLLVKAKILGILTPIQTFCGGTCYLISKSKTEHIIIIPDDIKRLNYDYDMRYGTIFNDYIKRLKGNVVVIGGGKNLKDTNSMFADCNFDNLDISKFDTSNVTNMRHMFYWSNIKNVNLEKLDTSNVEYMDFMFAQCDIRNLDFSHFDTHNVLSMQYMFFCSYTGRIDLRSFNTRKVIDMQYMFCNNISDEVDLTSFMLNRNTKTKDMFKNTHNNFRITDKKLRHEFMNTVRM